MTVFRHAALIVASLLALPWLAYAEGAGGGEAYRIAGPLSDGNLALYLIHGQSAGGAVPLTLDEALPQGLARVYETDDVTALDIENLGDQEVFVQSGDIVKGGLQDRVLAASLALPPHSGRVPIASFCVEHDRWSGRAGEDARSFTSAGIIIPSRAAKMAMRAAPEHPFDARTPGEVRSDPPIWGRQQEVWNDVARLQDKLSARFGTSVAAPKSPSSLELTLENETLKRAPEDHIAALQPAGEADSDIIGFAFAINGTLNSAEIYPSNGLFRKMWPKLLRAAVVEALAEKTASAAAAAPAPERIRDFLDAPTQSKAVANDLDGPLGTTRRETAGVIYLETTRATNGAWVHRSFLAK